MVAYCTEAGKNAEFCPPHPKERHFPRFTWQSSQQSPCAHTAPGFKAQVVALQHGFVHSCMDLEGKFRADNVQSPWAVNQEAAYSSAKKSWAWNHELCMKFDNLIQTALSALRFNKPNKCSKTRGAAEEGWFIPAMELIPNITTNPSVLTPTLIEHWGVLLPQESVEWLQCLQRGSRSCCSCWASRPRLCFVPAAGQAPVWMEAGAATEEDNDTIPCNPLSEHTSNRAVRYGMGMNCSLSHWYIPISHLWIRWCRVWAPANFIVSRTSS